MKFKRAAALLCSAAMVLSTMPLLPVTAADVSVENVTLPSDTNKDGLAITKFGAARESAYIEWTNDEADTYSVFVKPNGTDDSAYVKIDDELVRYYGNYYRADALGLKAGKYDLKVQSEKTDPTTNIKTTKYEYITGIEVTANIREGFAFEGGNVPGAYNMDGTLKSNANIIYITNDNKQSVKATIYEGTKAHECTGLEEIMQYLGKNKDGRPTVIRIIGTIDGTDLKGAGDYFMNSAGYWVVKGCSNLTIEGVGNDATLKYIGMLIRDDTNVEVRNLGVMLFADDGISLDTDNNHIWVHNNDIYYGMPGSDKDQVKGDGSLDTKKTKYVTHSENHFWDSGKAALIDASATTSADGQSNYLTYHHNWFDHSDSRHPRTRHASVHLYNNYYDGNSKYGVGVTSGACAFVEKNVFRNCTYPMLSSNQGTDAEGEGTFSGEAGGIIKAFDNRIEGGEAPIYASETNTNNFDAYLAKTRDEVVPSNYTTKVSNGFNNTYNNFDTNSSIMYDYTPESTSTVVDSVTTYAGRGWEGDMKYSFDNSTADESHDIDNNLKNMLLAYSSKLVRSYEAGKDKVYPYTGNDQAATPAPTPSPKPTPDPNAKLEPVTTATTWDFTSLDGAYEESFVTNNMKIYAASGKAVETSTAKKDTTYPTVLNLKGTGTPGTHRTVGILPGAEGTVTVRFDNSNSTERTMAAYVANASGGFDNVKEASATNGSATLTYEVTADKVGKEVQFGSTNSSLYLCYIKFTPKGAVTPTVDPTTTPSADPTTTPSANPTTAPTTAPSKEPQTELKPVTEKTEWTFENLTGPYSDSFISNNMKFYANATKQLKVQNPKYATGYDKVLTLAGAASFGEHSAVSFIPGVLGTIEVVFENTNATDTRTMQAYNTATKAVVATQDALATSATLTYELKDTDVNKEIQFGSKSSGLNIAAVIFTPKGDAPIVTESPSPTPSATPTAKPTTAPTATPTTKPTTAPTATPTAKPTTAPTATPTAKPEKTTEITYTDGTVKITSDKAQSAVIVKASYEGGRLIGVELKTVELSADKDTTLTMSAAAGDKFMLLDAIDKMKPLCKAYTVK